MCILNIFNVDFYDNVEIWSECKHIIYMSFIIVQNIVCYRNNKWMMKNWGGEEREKQNTLTIGFSDAERNVNQCIQARLDAQWQTNLSTFWGCKENIVQYVKNNLHIYAHHIVIAPQNTYTFRISCVCVYTTITASMKIVKRKNVKCKLDFVVTYFLALFIRIIHCCHMPLKRIDFGKSHQLGNTFYPMKEKSNRRNHCGNFFFLHTFIRNSTNHQHSIARFTSNEYQWQKIKPTVTSSIYRIQK